MTIRFLKIRDPYGFLSNFYPVSFEWKGRTWATSEHAYQAAKFLDTDPEWASKIEASNDPWEARNMGQSRKHPIPDDWDERRVEVMLDIVRTKFEQNSELAEKLVSTRDEELVENYRKDHFWADGGDGSGRNVLGRILMKVRDELKERDD